MSVRIRKAEGRLLDVTVLGSMEDRDRQDVLSALQTRIRECGSARVVVDAEKTLSPRPPEFWREAAAGFPTLRNVERVAIVGDQSWQTALSEEPRGTDAETVRFFESGMKPRALSWLRGEGKRAPEPEKTEHE